MLVHIGTYDESGGQGLVSLKLTADGSLEVADPYATARNASFGVRRNGLVYLVDEQEEGALGIHRKTDAGWELLGCVSTGGEAPCYVALDESGRRIAVANYESGSVAAYALGEQGLPSAPAVIFQNEGSGPNKERQEGPHAHCVRFHGGALYVVDLGVDQVLRLELTDTGLGEASVAWTAPAGSGPRHLLFHPAQQHALLLCELAATLTLLRVGHLGFETVTTVPTAPADFTGDNLGGHLELGSDGTRVYVSNRGHNSIAVFALEDGELSLLQRIDSGGDHPRHFALIGDKLIVAHEKDGRISTFQMEQHGTLTPAGVGVTVPGACFVLT